MLRTKTYVKTAMRKNAPKLIITRLEAIARIY